MKPLIYLVFKKSWGVFRGWFKKPISALLTILAGGFFLVSIVGLMLNPVEVEAFDFAFLGAIMGGLFTMILLISLLSKNKSLVFLNDATFVLAGPFTKKQVLGYVLLNNTVQNVWITLGLLGYILVFLNSSLSNIFQVVWLLVVGFSAGLLMMVVSSWDYVMEKGFANYMLIKKIVLLAIGLVSVGVVYSQLVGMPLSWDTLISLLTNKVIFYVPFIGWILGSFYYAGIGMWGIASLFVLALWIGNVSVGLLFFNTKVDFYEFAIMDAVRTQEILSKAKEGASEEALLMNKKIKQKSGKFYSGALALWSSFVLQQRKRGQFLKVSELFFLGLYTIIAYMSGDVFLYRVLVGMAVFFNINSDALRYELKRHFVYIIPEAAFKKMMILLLPLMYRVMIMLSIAGVVSVVLFNLSIIDAILFVLSLFGICLSLVGGTALTLRFLKGQKNALVEQFLRIIVVLVVLIPSIALSVALTFSVVPFESENWMAIISMVVFIINFIVTLGVIKLSSKLLIGNDMFAS